MSQNCQREAKKPWDTEKTKQDAAPRWKKELITFLWIIDFDTGKKNIGNAYGIRHAVQSTKKLRKKDLE